MSPPQSSACRRGAFVLGTVIRMIPCIAIYAVLGGGLDSAVAAGRDIGAGTVLQPKLRLKGDACLTTRSASLRASFL